MRRLPTGVALVGRLLLEIFYLALAVWLEVTGSRAWLLFLPLGVLQLVYAVALQRHGPRTDDG